MATRKRHADRCGVFQFTVDKDVLIIREEDVVRYCTLCHPLRISADSHSPAHFQGCVGICKNTAAKAMVACCIAGNGTTAHGEGTVISYIDAAADYCSIVVSNGTTAHGEGAVISYIDAAAGCTGSITHNGTSAHGDCTAIYINTRAFIGISFGDFAGFTGAGVINCQLGAAAGHIDYR